MKKILYRVSALLLVAGLSTSCLDEVLEVESQSSFDASIVYSQYQMAEYTVLGIGEIFAHTNSYNARLNCYYGYNTDIELKMGHQASGAKLDEYTLSEYNTQIGNGSMNTANNGYNEIMIGIERANLAIDGLRQYGNVEADRDMAYLLGEALTYRAFYYEELVKMWGEAPLHLTPLSADDLYAPKNDRDDIYLAILSDLEEAIGYLYWPFEATQTQRADRMNKAFAKGLYARVALMAAGYSWRPDDGAVGTGNPGSLRLSTRPELSKAVLYPKALKHLEDVINSGSLQLESSYEGLWRAFNDFSHMTSPEVMYVQPFANGRGRWNYAHAYTHKSSPYLAGNSRNNMTGPNPTLWWKYEKQDVRRDLTCVAMQYSKDANDGEGGWEMKNVNSFSWGKYRYEWMNGYDGGTGDGCKPIVMRYADVYLMAAELAAYLSEADGGGLTKAKQYLGEVRRRAYAGNADMVETYLAKLTLGSAAGSDNAAVSDYNAENTIMKAIIDERALEFAGEFLRKQDLIRWGLLKIKLDEASADLKALGNMEGAYADYASYTEDVDVKDDKTKEVLYTYPAYYVYWREKGQGVEFYGLEKDQIGKTPEGYNGKDDDGGWNRLNFLSSYAFYSDNLKLEYSDERAYRWSYFYSNDYNDPYPRSVWPLFGQNLNNSQGTLVNDYGYENL